MNAAAGEATANILILDSHGVQIVEKSLSLSGHSQQQIKVGDLLRSVHSGIEIGSIELVPDANSAAHMSVLAQLSLESSDPSRAAYLEEEFLMPSNMNSNVFHASSSSVLGRPALALMSTSMEPQTVTVACLLLKSSNTVFAGVPIGGADVLPGDSFTPEIAIANSSSQPAAAQVLYSVTSDSGTDGRVIKSVSVPARVEHDSSS